MNPIIPPYFEYRQMAPMLLYSAFLVCAHDGSVFCILSDWISYCPPKTHHVKTMSVPQQSIQSARQRAMTASHASQHGEPCESHSY